MTARLTSVCLLSAALLLGCLVLPAKTGDGKPFGARNPRSCTAQQLQGKGTPTADQLKLAFICEEEAVSAAATGGTVLTLVTDVKMEVAKGRPFQMATDAWPDIDPSQPVYNVRGSFIEYRCTPLGKINGNPGANCMKYDHPSAKGECFKNTFGEWRCKFTDLNAQTTGKGVAPPAGQ